MEKNIIIGLEVHVQLNTKTKLFCRCPTKSLEPNTAICPTCLGHPGSKPTINEKALEYGAKLAIALGCKIASNIIFSRKTYFYPDLSKNFQITQYEEPLGTQGQIILANDKIVKIKRVHIEEDPGALIRETGSVLIDYNRSGIPLCEVVTEPDMNSPTEAREFLNKLLNILGYLGIYDSENCIIKADANISIKEKNYVRVEIKNITGFKEIEKALEYEILRQKEQEVIRETRGWDSEKGITYSMRTKEEEADYGYITEPDLPTFEISNDWIRAVQESIPELAETKAKRWTKEWKIDVMDAKIISADIDVAKLYEETAKIDPILVARWTRREILKIDKPLKETQYDVETLKELYELLKNKKITDRIGQRIIEQLADKKFSPKAYVTEQKLEMTADEDMLKKICEKAIQENPKAVEDYKKGEQKAIMFLIGQVMKETKGTASPTVLKEILIGLLK